MARTSIRSRPPSGRSTARWPRPNRSTRHRGALRAARRTADPSHLQRGPGAAARSAICAPPYAAARNGDAGSFRTLPGSRRMLSCIEHHTFTLDLESPMTAASDAVCLDGTISGRLRPVPAQVSSDDPLVARTRAVWTSGDFDRIARGFTDGAVAFIDRLQ